MASDIHLGYGEKMAERSMDSFNSFDELLGIGKERNVDLCILGWSNFSEWGFDNARKFPVSYRIIE